MKKSLDKTSILKELNFSKAYLLPVVVGVLIVGLSVLVVKPQVSSILKLRKKLKAEKETLKKVTQKASLLEGMSEPELDRRLKRVEAVYPSEKPAVQIINTVSQLAKDHELSFSGISLSPGEISTGSAEKKSTKDKKTLIQTGFTVEGEREKVFDFLGSIEKTTPVMRVEGLSLAVIENEVSGESFLSAEVSVSVFYRPAPESIGEADQPLSLLTSKETQVLAEIEGFQVFSQFEADLQNVGRDNPFEF